MVPSYIHSAPQRWLKGAKQGLAIRPYKDETYIAVRRLNSTKSSGRITMMAREEMNRPSLIKTLPNKTRGRILRFPA